MRKVLNFVKGKKEDKKDQLNLNVSPIAVEITDPAGVTTPSDDYDFADTPQKSSDYEVSKTCYEQTFSFIKHTPQYFSRSLFQLQVNCNCDVKM